MAPAWRNFPPVYMRPPLPPAGLFSSFMLLPQQQQSQQQLQPWQQAQVGFRHLIDTSRLPPPQNVANTVDAATTRNPSNSSNNSAVAVTAASAMAGSNFTVEGFS